MKGKVHPPLGDLVVQLVVSLLELEKADDVAAGSNRCRTASIDWYAGCFHCTGRFSSILFKLGNGVGKTFISLGFDTNTVPFLFRAIPP